MTNFENEEPQAERFTDRHDAEPYTREHLDAAVDLVDKISELAAALRSDRMADKSQYEFMFEGEKIRNMYLPDTIQSATVLYGSLEEIVISMEQDEGSPTSSISFRLHFVDDDGKNTLIKVERPGHYKQMVTQSGDHLVELGYQPKYREISSIQYQDLNRMTASLIYPPNKDSDFSMFDTLDLNDSTIYEALVAALQKHTPHYIGQEYYELHSKSGVFTYSIDNGELISAELSQTKFSDIVIEDNQPKKITKSLSTEIDLSNGLTLMFSTVTEKDEEIDQKIFTPELTDYAITNDFINYHIQLTHPVETERMNELTMPPSQRAIPGDDLS